MSGFGFGFGLPFIWALGAIEAVAPEAWEDETTDPWIDESANPWTNG